MSLQLMHIQYHATSVVQRKVLFETVSRWIDERIRADSGLSAEARNDPASVNLLRKILTEDEPAATGREAALTFTGLVERFTGNAPRRPCGHRGLPPRVEGGK